MEMNENNTYENCNLDKGLYKNNRIKALKNLAIGTGIAAVVGLGSLLWINRDKLNLDNLEKMTVGKISLTFEETGHAWMLTVNPKFQYSKGKNKGEPNYRLITKEINNQYWNGDNVRTAFTLESYVKKSYGNSKPSKEKLEAFKSYKPYPVDVIDW